MAQKKKTNRQKKDSSPPTFKSFSLDLDNQPEKDDRSCENIKKPLISSFDIDNLDLKGQQEALKGHRYKQDTKERKLLSHWVICVVSIWLFLVISTLICNSLLSIGLSDTVCVTLLTTTTINILGLAYIVLKGLFPSNEK